MSNSNDPLHGVRLDRILEELTNRFSWEQLANKIPINCFKSNPTIKSSLKFLRKTPWARRKVETLWVWTFVDSNYLPPESEKSKEFKARKTNQPKKPNGFNPWLDK